MYFLYFVFFIGPKAVKKPFLDEKTDLNATSALVQWYNLPSEDVYGKRRDWTLAYIPDRDTVDYIIPTPSRRRKRRALDLSMDEYLQTDWYDFLSSKASIRCDSENM